MSLSLTQLFPRSSNPSQLHYGDQSSGKAHNQLGAWPGPEPSGLRRYRYRDQQSMMLPLRFHACFLVDSGLFGLCTLSSGQKSQALQTFALSYLSKLSMPWIHTHLCWWISYFTWKSILSNEIIWWYWSEIWAGHVPD